MLIKLKNSQILHHRIIKNEAENIVLDREVSSKRYISPAKRQKIISGLRSIQLYNNWLPKSNKFVR